MCHLHYPNWYPSEKGQGRQGSHAANILGSLMDTHLINSPVPQQYLRQLAMLAAPAQTTTGMQIHLGPI